MYKDFWPWAGAHTWESWRNRYNKNQYFFDRLIDRYLEGHPPHPEGKGEYNYKRSAANYAARAQRKRPRVINERRAGDEDVVVEEDRVEMQEDGVSNEIADDGRDEPLSGDEGQAVRELSNGKEEEESIPEEGRGNQSDHNAIREGSIDFSLYV